jgi:diguanylate cyclase (GGDEF)-like protein
MTEQARSRARLDAYRLMEALQGGAHDAAAAALVELRALAEASGWTEVRFLADLGEAMAGVVRPGEGRDTSGQLDALVSEAETLDAPALLAHALGLRAITAAVRSDTDSVLTDAGRALALLDTDQAPTVDASAALVVCAAAFNALGLWELVDEIYDRAAELEAGSDAPLQTPAIAINRVLIRIEWATERFELGERAAAREQLARAADAAARAIELHDLPDLWRTGIIACQAALTLCLAPPEDPTSLLAQAESAHKTLRTAGDLEVLPLTQTMVALALLRLGQPGAALDELAQDLTLSSSSGAHSFRLWVRAQAVTASQPTPGVAVDAYRDYATMLAAQRFEARRALLAAARSRIAGERLRAERNRLFRDVALDALTGLGNRRAFDSWLDHDRPVALPTAMLLIDLDDFKTINDRHGHAAGDEVLRRVGRAIAQHVRPRDLALRLGGDEFVVIIEARPEESSSTEALAVSAHDRALSLRRTIENEPWSQIAPELMVSASVGVSTRALDAHDRAAAGLLYEAADRDLYANKELRQRG